MKQRIETPLEITQSLDFTLVELVIKYDKTTDTLYTLNLSKSDLFDGGRMLVDVGGVYKNFHISLVNGQIVVNLIEDGETAPLILHDVRFWKEMKEDDILKQQAAEIAALRGFAQSVLLNNEVDKVDIKVFAEHYKLIDETGNPTKLLTGKEI